MHTKIDDAVYLLGLACKGCGFKTSQINAHVSLRCIKTSFVRYKPSS